MSSFFIFLCIVTTIVAVLGSNYCEMPCKDYRTGKVIPHIGCNPKGFNKNSCPPNAKMVEMTSSLKDLFVELHNEKRNLIAGGKIASFSPACRMATMQWDDELAKLAELNVKQCAMNHDQCHNTKTFKSSGQNLGHQSRTPPGEINAKNAIEFNIERWFNEYKITNPKFIDSYPSKGPMIGHFTAMVADHNVRLGCAASTYTMGSETHILIACNYAKNNMINQTIYEKCRKAAKYCQTGTNPHYPNLCSELEVYDVNN